MGYEYDHDCPFEAFITNLGKYNEGELVGEWVKFPTTSEELQKVFERIGIGSKDEFGNPYEEWFISDYDCYVSGLYDKLILIGISKILLTQLNIEKGQKVITNISLVLGILAVLYLALTRDAYAITVVFVLLIIKVMLLFKVNER